MKKQIKTICTVAMVVASFGASAQQPDSNSQEMRDKVKSAMDAAYEQAKRSHGGAPQGNDKPGFGPAQLRQLEKADPSDVAARFRASIPKPVIDEDRLMIFVSTGMPTKALQLLGEQARAAGATLIFRGLRMPLGKPGAMEDMASAIAPLSKTGADIQINPEAFSKYRVTAVPTFVIAAKEEGCMTDQCASRAYALAGDVTLEYALETWANRGGTVGKKADHYLTRLERVRNSQ